MSDYRKPDFWAQKAQKEGYPARSVYKLQEIDEKFGILRRNTAPFKVLDLGAAPGSWSLFVRRKLGAKGALTSCDLSALTPQTAAELDAGLGENGFLFFQGDLTSDAALEALQERGPFDLIISDAAPATTGNRLLDTSRSAELCSAVLDWAQKSLTLGGALVCKVFQGEGVQDLLARLRLLFKTARTYKPKACRGDSFETYLIGLERASTAASFPRS